MKVKFTNGKKVHWILDEYDWSRWEEVPYPLYAICGASGYTKKTDEAVSCEKCLARMKRNRK